MFKCKFCSKEFSRKDVLKKHLKDRSCKITNDLFELHGKLIDNVLIKEPIQEIIQEPKVQTITQESNEVNLLVKTFEQNNITIYGTFDKPLFKANDIGDLLGISNIRESIKDFTDKQRSVSLTDTGFGIKETTMLTEQGLYKVILRSRKPIAVKFQDWVCEVIEEIRKTGEYKSRKLAEIKKSNDLFIQQYNGKSVNYLANVEEKDGYIIKKYGQTTYNLYERLKSHQKQYGDNFHFTNVIECDNIQELEKRIQTHKLLKDRHVKSYKGKLTKELIKLDDKFTEKDLLKIIYEIKDTLNNNNVLKLEQERTKQIEEQERTKQEQEKTKQKELEFEIKKMEFEMMKLQYKV
jgi:prophage antirepressor-like protein